MIGNDARNRGASYMMDAYEAQYENNSGEYEDGYNQNEYIQLEGCAKLNQT